MGKLFGKGKKREQRRVQRRDERWNRRLLEAARDRAREMAMDNLDRAFTHFLRERLEAGEVQAWQIWYGTAIVYPWETNFLRLPYG